MKTFRAPQVTLLVLMAACSKDLPTPTGPITKASPEGTSTHWVHAYAGEIQIDGMASDLQGNVYTAGYFVGQGGFDPTHIFQSAENKGEPTKDIFIAKHTRETGAIAWVKHFGGAGLEGNVYDLVGSPDGTIVASGAFSGTVDFGGTVLTASAEGGSGSASSGSYGSMFLAALDGEGNVKWAQAAGGDRVSGGNEIAADPTGGFVQVGMYGGTADPGGNVIVGGLSLPFGGGRFDTYVGKLSSTGVFAWAKPITGSGSQRGKAIAADKQGNIIVAGDAWDGDTTFGEGLSFSAGKQDFWVAKYAPNGAVLWFHNYSSSEVDEVKGVAIDHEGNIAVAASFSGPSIAIAGKTFTAVAGARNTGIIFKLSADGNSLMHATTMTAVGKCCEIEMDEAGTLFAGNTGLDTSVTYSPGGSFTLGGSVRSGLLTRMGASGTVNHSWTIQAEESEFGELSLLPQGFVAVAGSFEGGSAQIGDITVQGSSLATQIVAVIDGKE